jgi:hypothetical protein
MQGQSRPVFSLTSLVAEMQGADYVPKAFTTNHSQVEKSSGCRKLAELETIRILARFEASRALPAKRCLAGNLQVMTEESPLTYSDLISPAR